jgi:hypothetical protein
LIFLCQKIAPAGGEKYFVFFCVFSWQSDYIMI